MAGSSASFVPGPQNAILNIPSKGDESMNRYKNMYEERMNPFEAFRGRVCPRYMLVVVDVS